MQRCGPQKRCLPPPESARQGVLKIRGFPINALRAESRRKSLLLPCRFATSVSWGSQAGFSGVNEFMGTGPAQDRGKKSLRVAAVRTGAPRSLACPVRRRPCEGAGNRRFLRREQPCQSAAGQKPCPAATAGRALPRIMYCLWRRAWRWSLVLTRLPPMQLGGVGTVAAG